MRATIEAIAGAVAIRKPAEVKNMEKAEIVSMRRKRARRRGGNEEAVLERQLELPCHGIRGKADSDSSCITVLLVNVLLHYPKGLLSEVACAAPGPC